MAAEALRELEPIENDRLRKKGIVRAVETVAKHLGNTPAICRRCYIHPAILDSYLEGTLLETLAEKTRRYLVENVEGMSAEEAAVTAFLRLRLTRLAEESRENAAEATPKPTETAAKRTNSAGRRKYVLDQAARLNRSA